MGALPTGWTLLPGYGGGSAAEVGLASDEFHSPPMALKSDTMMTTQARAQTSLTSIGATAAKHWGRIFYKVASPAPVNSSGVLHVTFVGLFPTTPVTSGGLGSENRVVDTVEANNGTHQWLYNLPSDGCSEGSAYNWKYDTAWHCAEWYVDVSTNSYRFFSDSQEVTSIGFTGKTCDMMATYEAIGLGSTFFQQPNAPWIMWIDDLAIDDNQIGCE
ncbi:MAG: hypothetical protein ABSC94_05700 [Polyangiaceae bacterium]